MFAVQFNGNGLIDFGDIFQMGLSNMTIEAWVRLTTAATGQYVVSRTRSLNVNHRYILLVSAGKARAFMSGNAAQTDVAISSNTSVNDGEWHHIAAVFDRLNNIRIYVDGVLDGTSASIAHWSTIDMTNYHPLRIGAGAESDGVTPNNFFNGTIDEVRVWNVIRTEADLAANMNKSLVGNEPGLIGYLKFDEGQGDTVTDSVAGHIGTASNIQWTAGAPISAPISGGDTTTVKVRIGGVWQTRRVKYYNGTSWETKKLSTL